VRNSSNAQQGLTVGVDLGDKYSHVCVLNAHGEIVEEGRIATTREALERRFAGMAPAAMAIEAGTHSNWVYDLLTSLGHDVVVANPRKLRAITANERKSDQMDARMLARLRRADSQLLSPVVPRAEHMRRDLGVMRARAALVQARTMLVNHVRGVAKSSGSRLRKCSAESLHKAELPADLVSVLAPLLQVLERLTEQVHVYDQHIAKLSKESYPQTSLLRQVQGVGPLTALCFTLTIGDAGRFKNARAAGAYAGLTPRRDQSGDRDPELRITKCGDEMLRTLLVQCAHRILGPFGPDCDLRRFGLKLAERGGKNAKRRAVVATARKLSVLLLALMRSGEVYEPLRNSPAARRASA